MGPGVIAAVGLDLSLTSTGVARVDGSAHTLKNNLRGPERISFIVDSIVDELQSAPDDLVVVVEAPFIHGLHSKGQAGILKLHGVLEDRLHRASQPWVTVPPSVLKKYATGSGAGHKGQVLVAAVKRLEYDGSSHDEADALWLRHMALDHYGHAQTQLPAGNRAVLDKIDWPALNGGPF